MTEAEITDLRPALTAELQRLRETEVGRRMAAIELLLSADGDMPDLPAPAIAAASTGRRGRGVSDVKIAAVREYMSAHITARQVDVARDLGENTGSVSLALRALQDAGEVRDTGRVENKAKVWEYTGEPAEKPEDGNPRATVIDVGNEVREGRRLER